MRVRHPNSVRETDDDVDSGVTVMGETYAVDGDGYAEMPERHASAWAESYEMDVADLTEDDETADDGDSGVCDAIKGDGEVCGRELPCPYHS